MPVHDSAPSKIEGPPAPPPDAIGLFDRLASIDLQRFPRGLSKLDCDFPTDDPVGLLFLAEQAMQWGQWQSAAQFYALMMVRSFERPYDKNDLATRANQVVLLTRKHRAGLSSAPDLLLYGYRRLTAALSSDELLPAQVNEWMRIAFCHLASGSPLAHAAMKTALSEMRPGDVAVSRRYEIEIGPARELLQRSLALAAKETAAATMREFPLLGLLIASVLVIGVACWWWRDSFSFPQASTFFRGANWLGAALLAWPLLLVVTWIFALLESRRTGAIYFVSPRHFVGPPPTIGGEIMPFIQDWFFHIFQFVWIPFLYFAWQLLRQHEKLLTWLPTRWREPNDNTLSTFLASLTPSHGWVTDGDFWTQARGFFGSDTVALLAASGFAAFAVSRQIRIQIGRVRSPSDIYWWDWRVSRHEYLVRLLMVGVDTFLAVILLLKLVVISIVSYQLVTNRTVSISYFAPDGVGGLKPLTDMLTNLSWLVFLFGFFVLASIFMHRNLREYRTTDRLLIVTYVVLVMLTMAPLGILEFQFNEYRDAALAGIPLLASNLPSPDAVQHVRDVTALRDWHVSAVTGIIGSPVLWLFLQSVLIFGKSLMNAGKLPKLPIPGLGGSSAARGRADGGG